MSLLMESPSPPSTPNHLPSAASSSRPSPINTYHITRSIANVSTDLLIQTFDDRILVVITQNQKIGILTQASIPHVTQLPHPTPSTTSIIPNLPPPPPGLNLTPLLGAPRPEEQALYDLYVSQVATLIWWTLNEVGAMRRPVVVGLALAKASTEDEGDDTERERFGEVLKMVIEWPGPQ